jgi:hypothetical protein
LIAFGVSLYLANKYSDKTLRFYKNRKCVIFVDLGRFSTFSYILASITRRVTTSRGIILRRGLLEKTKMDYKLTFFFFGESMTIFLLVTLILKFLLIYGKAALAGMPRSMLIHYRLILNGSGKGKGKEETR